MFIHDNGKVCIAVAPRCGHTSMAHYFRQTPHVPTLGIWDWIRSSSRKILVLRNTYDRYQSALTHAEDFPYGLSIHDDITKEEWIHAHTKPHLIEIPSSVQFEIIDFNKLSEYIPLSADTHLTNTSSVHHTKLKISPVMRKEHSRYLYYMKYCKEITPEEWKLLTIGDDSGILEE